MVLKPFPPFFPYSFPARRASFKYRLPSGVSPPSHLPEDHLSQPLCSTGCKGGRSCCVSQQCLNFWVLNPEQWEKPKGMDDGRKVHGMKRSITHSGSHHPYTEGFSSKSRSSSIFQQLQNDTRTQKHRPQQTKPAESGGGGFSSLSKFVTMCV